MANDHTETDADDLMIQQIEQMSRDVQKRLESLKDDMNGFEQRLARLESSESETKSSDSQDRSEERRKVFYKVLERLKRVEKGTQENYLVLRSRSPMCVRCKHSMLMDGSILQYTGDKDIPEYSYSGYIVCAQIPGVPFPMRQAPTDHCMFFESDGGEEDLKKP